MSKTPTISAPAIGERKFAMPETPAGISPTLRSAIEDYRAHLWGDGTALSGDTWSNAALAIANHAPASLTEAALKLLWLTHYAEPTQDSEGRAEVDLAAFDCDIGHHLIRVAADILTFEVPFDGRRAWVEALVAYQAKRAYSDSLADDHPEIDEAVDAYCIAMDRLIDTRAPSHAALIHKMDLIEERYEDFNTPESVWAEVRKDVAALGAAAKGGGAAMLTSSFSPAEWLDDFTTLGGGWVDMGERIAFLTAGVFAQDLTFMMAQLVGRPDRMNAVKAEIAARAGEVFA